MKEQLNKILSTFTEFWKAQDKKRKTLYIVILAAVVVIAVVLTVILNIKHDKVLYTGLEKTEANEIMTQIDTMGVDATLTNGGQISVPEDKVNAVRMQMATLGYPKSALNYDVWNNNVDMFTTDTEKREQARMQLQERLIATIQTLSGVDKAIVTLDIPEQKDTVINVNAKPSKASIVLHLKQGVQLTDEQISGVQHIVLMSVSGLTEENISITDGTGALLVVGQQKEDTVAIERNKLLFKKEVEDATRNEVLSLLTPAYGDDGVKVAVNYVLNYDKQVSEDTTYTPSHDDGSAMIQHQDNKNASGTDGTSGGTVGAEPNADGTYPTTDTSGSNGAWSQSENSTSYLVNTLKKQIEKSGFTYDSRSVSVMIYTDLLSDDDIAKLTTAVSKAAGVSEEFVSVANLPKLSDSTAASANNSFPFGWSRNQFFIFIAVLLILIIVFMAMYLSVSKAAKRKRRAIDRKIYAAAQLAGESGQVDGFFNAGTGEGQKPIPAEVASLNDANVIETKETAVRREIGEFAHASPEIVAQLLKSWLREDEKNGSSSSGSGSSGGGRRR